MWFLSDQIMTISIFRSRHHLHKKKVTANKTGLSTSHSVELECSVIQILREINLGESSSSKTAVFAIFGALNFVSLVNFSLQKVQKFMKSQNSESLIVLKWQLLSFQNSEN